METSENNANEVTGTISINTNNATNRDCASDYKQQDENIEISTKNTIKPVGVCTKSAELNNSGHNTIVKCDKNDDLESINRGSAIECVDEISKSVEITAKDTSKTVNVCTESAALIANEQPTTINNTKNSKSDNNYDSKNVHYEGEIAIYTDPSSGYQYQWDKDKNEWCAKSNVVYGFEDDTHTYIDSDGVKFFWDKEKSAWFPKINDDFMAQYQMNYGFIDNVTPEKSKEEQKPTKIEKKVDKGIKRKPSDPTWFELDDEQNTKVYVSNLPTDITEQEFVDFMQKCGLIMKDPITQKMKIKLYTEPGTNFLKGDALCTYIRIESVHLAMKLLDGMVLKDKKIKVERAKFQMRGNYDPTLKPKSKKRKEKQKLKKMQDKLFDWRPEKLIGEKAKHEKVVIVKNVFDSKVFDDEVGLILEYQQDLRDECSKCGEVRKVIIYDRHPEGVAQINMKEPEEADACVAMLNGRWFGRRQLTAEIWDGRTKFKIAETDSEISQRLDKWDQFLEDDSDKKNVDNITQ